MIFGGYRADVLKISGIVIAWPMPMSRSRATTTTASVIDSQETSAEPTVRMTLRRRSS